MCWLACISKSSAKSGNSGSRRKMAASSAWLSFGMLFGKRLWMDAAHVSFCMRLYVKRYAVTCSWMLLRILLIRIWQINNAKKSSVWIVKHENLHHKYTKQTSLPLLIRSQCVCKRAIYNPYLYSRTKPMCVFMFRVRSSCAELK